jgi:hypothetical protein
MPIDDLIAKMKAKGVPGSIEAEQVFEQLLSTDTQEPVEAGPPQKSTEETGSERIKT